MKRISQRIAMLKRFFPHEEAHPMKKIFFWFGTISIGLMLFGLIAFGGIIAVLSIGLPDVNRLENISAAQSTEIFDRNGKLLYTIHGEENRERVDLINIAKPLVDATISIEDDSYYEHGGFDIMALGKVALHEIFGIGGARGGSTITQQYIKNTFLSSEHSYLRKAKELILAVRLEQTYDKDKILELYLNRIPYGNNAYGIEKAAEIYLNKDAKDITIGESAVLASLPQAPTRYNPYGDNKFSHLLKEFTPEELQYRNIKGETDLEIEEYARGLIGAYVDLGDGSKIYIPGRSDLVLKRMFDLEKITADQRVAALNEIQKLTFNDYKESIKHYHFVMYIKRQLEVKYGKDMVEQGGLKVYTTLDSDIQDYAEEIAAEKGPYNIKTYGSNNIALMTINAKTGQILAMLGSWDYQNEKIKGMNNVALLPRQPGSSFKPIVYAQAFYNGYAPGNVIYDVPTKIGGTDTPQDYDGKWQGQITVRRALGQSRNIPAIKAYFLAGQQDNIIDLATKMGVTTLDKKRSYGYPLALGAAEIPLIDMVTAYGTFANAGKRPELTGILKVTNSNSDILEEWKQKEFQEVLDPQIAYMISSILSDKSVAVGTKLFVNGKTNAAKTGTSTKQNKTEAGGARVRPSDGWVLGYTPTIVTGVWIGNTDGSGLGYNADGYTTAAPIWNAVMTKALEKMPNEQFVEPEGIKHVAISKASGKLPGPNTPASMIINDIFASFSQPTETENAFFKVKIDKISGLLATEFTPAETTQEVTFQNYQDIADMFNWNKEVTSYFSSHKSAAPENPPADGDPTAAIEGDIRAGAPPTEYDNVHTAETAAKGPSVTIINPVSQGSIGTGMIDIEVQVSSPNGPGRVEFYIDDQKRFFTTTAPFTGKLIIPRSLQTGSIHLIVAKVFDALGYSSQSAIEVKIAEPVSDVPLPPRDNTVPETP